jgi:hypothetical protein
MALAERRIEMSSISGFKFLPKTGYVDDFRGFPLSFQTNASMLPECRE